MVVGACATTKSTAWPTERILAACSSDLYTLVQELEDSYGVRISDEDAAKILTVGQAVEFVLARGVEA